MTDIEREPMTPDQLDAIGDVLKELVEERLAQHDKWGVQNHPNGTGYTDTIMRRWTLNKVEQTGRVEARTHAGAVGFSDILAEEVAEAFAETDPGKLRAELIQVAAVVVQWIETIDRRTLAQHQPKPHTQPGESSGVGLVSKSVCAGGGWSRTARNMRMPYRRVTVVCHSGRDSAVK